MIRVILIDDEEDALDLLEILLTQIGNIQVVGRYSDPLRAIDALGTIPVDAFFLDIQMPGMIGTAMARRIKTLLPHAFVIFTTAYSEFAVEAFEIHADDYLLKPFTMERLRSSVLRIKQSALHERTGDDIHYHIQCLGGFRVLLPHARDRILSWKTNKEKELCAFLVHQEGTPVDAAQIIEAIWPEHNLEKAKTYLYTCLSYLRKSLGENGIPASVTKADNGFAIRLDDMKSDTTLFKSLLAKAITEEDADQRLYDNLNTVYKGEYMEGCGYGWSIAKQVELKGAYIKVLRKWHSHFKEHGNSALAEDSLRQVMKIAPDSEKDGRELMELYMESGKRSEALNLYRQMEQAVHNHLDIELEEETRRLYKLIAWNRLGESR